MSSLGNYICATVMTKMFHNCFNLDEVQLDVMEYSNEKVVGKGVARWVMDTVFVNFDYIYDRQEKVLQVTWFNEKGDIEVSRIEI